MTPTSADVVDTAHRLADEVLFPAAPATDAADVLPRAGLDALAAAGLYGLRGPTWAGGADADLATIAAVTEILAGGCLTTAFVWSQHLGTPFVVAEGAPDLRHLVRPLCRGELRAGLALAGAQGGPEPLRARRDGTGWRLAGRCPWVSGWGRVDVVHTAALADDGRVVWSLVAAEESSTLAVERARLAALDATATVTLSFHDHRVDDDDVTLVTGNGGGPAGPPPATLRLHAALGLGVAARCCRLLGRGRLDEELAATRRRLDAAGTADMPAARAAAAELAVRSAAALACATGASAVCRDRHPQRLLREAWFTSVFAAPSSVREAYLGLLGARHRSALRGTASER